MNETTKPVKPLGRRAYGSIPHLPGSRMGPADHHCHEGQAAICFGKVRDRHDRVYVQEKLDGSCVAVARVGDSLFALGRAGYLAASSPYEQHQMFAAWVVTHAARFYRVLQDGERLVGEWLAQAHGTRYALADRDPFVAFDLMNGPIRAPYGKFVERLEGQFASPRLLSDLPLGLESAKGLLGVSGHGAIDPVEGAVWRVERRGLPEFLAKWVRPDKVDGKYLPEFSGGEAVWNWRPEGEPCGPHPKP